MLLFKRKGILNSMARTNYGLLPRFVYTMQANFVLLIKKRLETVLILYPREKCYLKAL